MTVSELYKQVAGLGFETSLEEDSRFFYAANRALLQVARIRPAVRTYTIYHAPLKNIASPCTFEPIERSEDLCFEAIAAKSFYFECNGNGAAYIDALEDGHWNVIGTVLLSSEKRAFRAYYGFIKKENELVSGPVRIRFTGMHLYSVKSVALYAQTLSDSEEDIPAYEPFTRYDISELADDFLGLASPPVEEAKNTEIHGNAYGVEGDRIILLPHESSGCYKVHYHHLPEAIVTEDSTAENSVQEIDLDPELAALMPPLVAAYIWAEDEPSLAEYYLTLYQQQAADIASKARSFTPAKIENNGW